MLRLRDILIISTQILNPMKVYDDGSQFGVFN